MLCDKIAHSYKNYLQPVCYYFAVFWGSHLPFSNKKTLHSPLWIYITMTFQRIQVQNKRQTAGQQNSHLHRRSCIDIIIGCNMSACGPSWFHLSPQRHNEQRSQGTNDQVAGSLYEALDVALYQNAGFDLAATNLSCRLHGLKLDGYNNNCGPLRDPLLRYFPLSPNNSPSQKRHTYYSLATVWFIALPDGNHFDNMLFEGMVTQTHFQSLALGFLLRWVQEFFMKSTSQV